MCVIFHLTLKRLINSSNNIWVIHLSHVRRIMLCRSDVKIIIAQLIKLYWLYIATTLYVLVHYFCGFFKDLFFDKIFHSVLYSLDILFTLTLRAYYNFRIIIIFESKDIIITTRINSVIKCLFF